MAMFLAENLFVVRGDRILFDGAGFALAPGGALLLLGRNGAGKSTLLRIVAGLRRPDAGNLSWDGTDIFADPLAHAGRLSWLSHLDAIKPGLSARENLAFAARTRGGNIPEALGRMGLADVADLPVRMFSAGQKRRLALARVMLGERPLWLLDEPAVGLDAASIEGLALALAQHRGGGGMVIAATHQDLPLPGAAVLRLGPE